MNKKERLLWRSAVLSLLIEISPCEGDDFVHDWFAYLSDGGEILTQL